jgi:translation initiation factor 4A
LPTSQAIILSPTRELAQQTHGVFKALSSHTKLKSQLLIGGTSVDRDIRDIEKERPQVFVGCPGRVLDFLERGVIQAPDIRLIVLDEADEILSSGFQAQLKLIFQFMTIEVQTVMFSATIPEELHDLVKKIMRDPIEILVKAEKLSLDGIAQYYINFRHDDDKLSALKDLYEGISLSQSIIYCNSVRQVEKLYTALRKDNFPVCCIHSEMSREERSEAFQDFKSGNKRVLISSNVTARGIDVQQVSIVVNYDVPSCVHNYLHRIGRSGRWGRKGAAINFVTDTRVDVDRMKMIESHYGTEIKPLPVNFADLLTS